MASSQERRESLAGNQKAPGQALQEKAAAAAILAVERLKKLLRDPDASNADALKAATLVFERVYPTPQTGAAAGDFDICIKEE